MKEKVLKEIMINGNKVKIELLREEAKNFPRKLNSSVKIEDKEVLPVSKSAIFL